jgi:hypothetical protein
MDLIVRKFKFFYTEDKLNRILFLLKCPIMLFIEKLFKFFADKQLQDNNEVGVNSCFS